MHICRLVCHILCPGRHILSASLHISGETSYRRSCPPAQHPPVSVTNDLQRSVLQAPPSCSEYNERPIGHRPSCSECNERPVGLRPSCSECNERPVGLRPSCSECNERPVGLRPSCSECNERPVGSDRPVANAMSVL